MGHEEFWRVKQERDRLYSLGEWSNALGDAVSKTSAWKDVYVAWFPYKQLSLTAAYVDLGTIATEQSQSGLYLSLTTSF
jgi:hypothetical protein